MAFGEVAMGVMFLTQTALGILGNSAFLCLLILADFLGNKRKATDLIVKHLTWANFLVILLKGIPQSLVAFGLTYFLDDVSCKLVFYVHRVARGVCLGCTSLLSIFQAITISPRNSKCMQLKVRVPKITVPSLGLCWALHLLLNAYIPLHVTDISGERNLSRFRDFVFCAIVQTSRLERMTYVILQTSIDVLGLGLMMWASGSMVLMLWKHKKRVKDIHTSLSPLSAPVTRATQSILALVSSFALSYIISVILQACFADLDLNKTRWLVNANVAMSACFPALCPFLLICHYNSLSKLCCTCPHKTARDPSVLRELERQTRDILSNFS